MSLTVCSVNWHTWKYIYFQDHTFRKLATDRSFRRLICNVSPGSEEMDRLMRLPHTSVYDLDLKGLRGSDAHGTALNSLLPRLETEYAVIADPDTAALIDGWDSLCRNALDGRTVAIGTPYPTHATRRFQEFPNAIFFYFHVDSVRRIDLDFRPESGWLRGLKSKASQYLPGRGPIDRDVGWQVPMRFREAGYEAHCFESLDCSSPRSVVLAPEARGDEHHYAGLPVLTHQGRSGPRGYDEDPISVAWLDRVCLYLGLDRRVPRVILEH